VRRGERGGSLRPYSRFSRPDKEPLWLMKIIFNYLLYTSHNLVPDKSSCKEAMKSKEKIILQKKIQKKYKYNKKNKSFVDGIHSDHSNLRH
jgi:hypothetical protein